MSPATAIRTQNLGKRYRLGQLTPYSTLRESIRRWAVAPVNRLLRREDTRSNRAAAHLWAVREVDLEIEPGEVVGVIGRNGAGKSTLLKLLTRITRPTTGRIEIRGRVGSLLEVGAGFHPELSGRENVFLNGAILGMTRSEIRRAFDSIVDFAGVEAFLDTPVKRYSSGMWVRLAFAVAAHLEPEILLIDEVLAVGDAEFQKKCLGKMNDVARGGRTVVFVSHNMAAVANLCTRGLLLDAGRVTFRGPMNETIDAYLKAACRTDPGFADLTEHRGRPHGYSPIITWAGIKSAGESGYRRVVRANEDLVIEIGYDTGDETIDLVQLGICTITGLRVTTVGTHLSPSGQLELRGKGVVECRLPKIRLSGGDYTLTVMAGRRTPPVNLDYVEEALQFGVEESDYFETGCALLPGQGYLVQKSEWRARQ